MYEIKYNDQDVFRDLIADQKIHRNGEYDFTYENRFILYHIRKYGKLHYVAFDLLTDREYSITTTKKDDYLQNTYTRLIPLIIERTRSHTTRDCTRMMVDRPFEFIDLIFRFVLPENGYAVREEQIKLCKRMYHGFLNKQVSVCEAEVGTGKTFAYLVAGLLARKYNIDKHNRVEPVTIVTATIELQKSLVEKEIPRLSQMLYTYGIIDRPLQANLLKGRKHYFCRLRYQDYIAGLQQHPELHHREIKNAVAVGTLPQGVDLDRYNLEAVVKQKMCVDGACSECPYCDTCEYIRMVNTIRENRGAEFQILNHNLYIVAMKEESTRTRQLHPSSFIVIDEAHNFRNTAEELYGEQLSETMIPWYISDTLTRCENFVIRPKHRAALSALRTENTALFADLRSILNDLSDFGNDFTFTISHRRSLTRMGVILRECEGYLPNRKGEISPSGMKVNNALQLLTKMSDNYYWIESDQNGEITLCGAPKNVTDKMYDCIWNRTASHVLTSGTMSDGNGFGFFKKENGLDRIPEHLLSEVQIESPFDYTRHARLYIPADLPLPDNHDRKYIAAVADRIEELIRATNGHTAILFTSYYALNAVYLALQNRLLDYNVIRMNSGDKTAIRDFQLAKNGVLFASGSMWEGVDCAGDCLSSVIIVRLPFPRRSIQMQRKKEQCDSHREFIDNHCVPSMIIKLRQGVGRLIRTETDTGVVSILDPRASRVDYHKAIVAALGKYPIIQSVDDIKEFIMSVKDADYYE